MSDSDHADIIPLQVTGTIDTNLSIFTANEMMVWALANLWNEGHEGGYHVQHSQHPVNDFGHPRNCRAHDSTPELDSDHSNFFEKAFPCLFPFGCGGIEADQEVPLGFQEHVQWALQYHDH